MVWDADFCYSKGHHPSQNTFAKVQTQDSTAKKFNLKDFKLKDSKPTNEKTSTPSCTN